MMSLHRTIKPILENEELEIAEDLQSLELESIRPGYRPGYKQYLQSPEHRLEQFLDQLESERRRWK